MAKKLTLEEKQQRLDIQKRVLKFEDEIKINTFIDLLLNFFYLNKITYISTVKKPNFTRQITGTARSIEDCYLLTKYYFPDMSYEMVYNTIEALYDNQKYGLSHWWCYNVCRRVHCISGWGHSETVYKKEIENHLKLKGIIYEKL